MYIRVTSALMITFQNMNLQIAGHQIEPLAWLRDLVSPFCFESYQKHERWLSSSAINITVEKGNNCLWVDISELV